MTLLISWLFLNNYTYSNSVRALDQPSLKLPSSRQASKETRVRDRFKKVQVPSESPPPNLPLQPPSRNLFTEVLTKEKASSSQGGGGIKNLKPGGRILPFKLLGYLTL